MATSILRNIHRKWHSGILAWKTSWTEEPGGLQSVGSQRVGHDWARKQAALEGYPWKWKLMVNTGQIVFSSRDQKDHLPERCFPPALRLNDWHSEQTVLVYYCSGRLDSKWLVGIITHTRNTKAQIPPRTKMPLDSWVHWPDKLVNLSWSME